MTRDDRNDLEDWDDLGSLERLRMTGMTRDD